MLGGQCHRATCRPEHMSRLLSRLMPIGLTTCLILSKATATHTSRRHRPRYLPVPMFATHCQLEEVHQARLCPLTLARGHRVPSGLMSRRLSHPLPSSRQPCIISKVEQVRHVMLKDCIHRSSPYPNDAHSTTCGTSHRHHSTPTRTRKPLDAEVSDPEMPAKPSANQSRAGSAERR